MSMPNKMNNHATILDLQYKQTYMYQSVMTWDLSHLI